MRIDNEKKPDALKGIKNKKEPLVLASYKHSDHAPGSFVKMNDGAVYSVRADGAWIKIGE